jgi:hypothetical protein
MFRIDFIVADRILDYPLLSFAWMRSVEGQVSYTERKVIFTKEAVPLQVKSLNDDLQGCNFAKNFVHDIFFSQYLDGQSEVQCSAMY